MYPTVALQLPMSEYNDRSIENIKVVNTYQTALHDSL
jgi:hypothetical protein